MNFNTEAVNDLKVFHTQLRPDGEWNMSIDTLLKVRLSVVRKRIMRRRKFIVPFCRTYDCKILCFRIRRVWHFDFAVEIGEILMKTGFICLEYFEL